MHLDESGPYQDTRQLKPPCNLLMYYFFHAFQIEFICPSLLSFFHKSLHLIFEYIQFIATGCVEREPLTTAHKVLKALTESVRRRTSLNRIYEVSAFLKYLRNCDFELFFCK